MILDAFDGGIEYYMKESNKKSKKSTVLILPVIALTAVIIALIVVFAVPKNNGGEKSGTMTAEETEAGVAEQTADAVAGLNEEGDLLIYADRLSSEQISFIRVSESSRIELLARLGDDGKVKAALGTCQSCNGSPKAYYTQEGSELKCNNCGLTFPISVLDSPGGGCHPIMMNEGIIRYEGNDLLIDMKGLSQYEDLFSKVADH